ncbi:glycosyltransferase family 2 protein [Patescibacteria group bacterium]|nr:glycosyltransferase family 2 protein [Patescibacteria group bacterium]
MRLIVIIPALNEEANLASVIKEIPRSIDRVDEVKVLILDDGSTDKTVQVAKEAGADFILSNPQKMGLARTFKRALEEALNREADIIVNTDGDNHYDQSKIPELIKPILDKKAEIVIGNRNIWELKKMPLVKKLGNSMGSWFVRTIARIPLKVDASSGYRAYSKNAALRLNILSDHTYAHETLIQAHDHGLALECIDIPARDVDRPSRLISSVPKHIFKSLLVIFRILTIYKPLRVMLSIGSLIFGVGLIFIIRFLYFYFTQGGEGHIQSLILASALLLIGFQICVLGLISSAVGWNRKILEENLYRSKKIELKK